MLEPRHYTLWAHCSVWLNEYLRSSGTADIHAVSPSSIKVVMLKYRVVGTAWTWAGRRAINRNLQFDLADESRIDFKRSNRMIEIESIIFING